MTSEKYSLTQGEAGVLLNACAIPNEISSWLAELPAVDQQELKQIRQDVWYASVPIAPHCDSTEPGHIVMGLVLRNDLGLILETEGTTFPILAGTLQTRPPRATSRRVPPTRGAAPLGSG